jgi:hypothetical protein
MSSHHCGSLKERPLLVGALCSLLPLAAAAAALAGSAANPPLDFQRDIQPILAARCVACHGDVQPQAGLTLRELGDVLEGGSFGPAVVPGHPDRSRLIDAIRSGRMPPAGTKVPAADLARLEQWVLQGARGRPAGGHWAFQPPKQHAPPAVRNAGAARNPLDRFLLARLESAGLGFSPEAERRTLLRRVTYDLIGLPPTPAESDAFVADARPDAYEQVVERLLADPRFGEHWARRWLDTAGYADSEGVLIEDRLRPNAWRYRDFLIRSFNSDLPYDEFLRRQIAGDELIDYKNTEEFTEEVVDTLAATGFLRTAVDATREDFNERQYGEYQYRMLHDLQTILVTSTMGLTVQCARCHDHKYEPLSQKDYYRMQALFTGAVRPRGDKLFSAKRQIVAAGPAEQERVRKHNAEVDAAIAEINGREQALLQEYRPRYLRAKLEEAPEEDREALLAAVEQEASGRTPEQQALIAKHKALVEAEPDKLKAQFEEFRTAAEAIAAQKTEQQNRRIVLPTIRALYDQDAAPPDTPLLIRGDWQRPGDPVEPGLPRLLDEKTLRPLEVPEPSPERGTTYRRRALGEWLTQPGHPLTGRVIVNRIWASYFGVGIVPSLDNFGRSGARPSHPELLDYLATSLERGIDRSEPWTLKALHRLIVTSAAYRQASTWRADAAEGDPENHLLWRQRPRRLQAEALRDAMLKVTGTLDETMYGEPVPNETRPTGEIVPAGNEQGGRRSLYILVRRSLPITLLNTFDAPVMEVNCSQRSPSVTATQALALMNGEFVGSQARHFQERLRREQPPLGGPETPPDPGTIDHAYRLALGRPPTPIERVAAIDFIAAQRALYRTAEQTPEEADSRAWTDFCHALLSANEFLYLD